MAADSAEAAHLLAYVEGQSSSNAHEQCLAGRAIYTAALRLPQPDRGAVLATLAKVESSS